MSKKAEELLQAAWAKALFEALCRYQPSPIFDEVAAEYGNPLSVERRAS